MYWGRKELCRRLSLELEKISDRFVSTAYRCPPLFTHGRLKTDDLLPVCTYGRVSVLILVCMQIKMEFYIRDGVYNIPITPLHRARTLSDEHLESAAQTHSTNLRDVDRVGTEDGEGLS